jgi:hypothetical protein
MMGDRSCAALGVEIGTREKQRVENANPELMVRALLADLVPFEELDSVILGIAGSTDSLMGTLAGQLEEKEVELPAEAMQDIAYSVFFRLGQEVTYGLLLAGADGRS